MVSTNLVVINDMISHSQDQPALQTSYRHDSGIKENKRKSNGRNCSTTINNGCEMIGVEISFLFFYLTISIFIELVN